MFDDTDYDGDKQNYKQNYFRKGIITKQQIEERDRQLEQDKPVDRKQVEGKPLPLLMPYEALVAYSEVSDYGLKKYGNRDSWTNSTCGVDTYANAACRHLFQHKTGSIDAESGLPHIYHALWSIAACVFHYEKLNEPEI
jgi:hypothetical protein